MSNNSQGAPRLAQILFPLAAAACLLLNQPGKAQSIPNDATGLSSTGIGDACRGMTLADCYDRKGQDLFKEGHYAKALPYFATAIEEGLKAKDSPEERKARAVYSNDRGMTYFELAENTGDKDFYDLAIGDFSQSLLLDNKPEVRLQLMTTEFHAHKFDGVIADANLLLKQAPPDSPMRPEYLTLRGLARRAKNDIAGAQADIGEALRLAPKNERALNAQERLSTLGDQPATAPSMPVPPRSPFSGTPSRPDPR